MLEKFQFQKPEGKPPGEHLQIKEANNVDSQQSDFEFVHKSNARTTNEGKTLQDEKTENKRIATTNIEKLFSIEDIQLLKEIAAQVYRGDYSTSDRSEREQYHEVFAREINTKIPKGTRTKGSVITPELWLLIEKHRQELANEDLNIELYLISFLQSYTPTSAEALQILEQNRQAEVRLSAERRKRSSLDRNLVKDKLSGELSELTKWLHELSFDELESLTDEDFYVLLQKMEDTDDESLYLFLANHMDVGGVGIGALWTVMTEKDKSGVLSPTQTMDKMTKLEKLWWVVNETGDSIQDLSERNLAAVTVNILSDPDISDGFKSEIMHQAFPYISDQETTVHKNAEQIVATADIRSMQYADAAAYLEALAEIDLLIESTVVWGYDERLENKLPEHLKEKYEQIDLPYLLRLRLNKIINTNDPYVTLEDTRSRDQRYPFRLSHDKLALRDSDNRLIVVDCDSTQLEDMFTVSEYQRHSFEASYTDKVALHQHFLKIANEYGIDLDDLYDAYDSSDMSYYEPNIQSAVQRIKDWQETQEEMHTEQDEAFEKLVTFCNKYGVNSWDEYQKELFTVTDNSDAYFLSPELIEASMTDEIWRDFHFLASGSTHELLNDEFGVEIQKLALAEQIFFLSYLKVRKESEIEFFKEFCNTYGNEGARTFLSIEKLGEDFGDKIIQLGTLLPKEAASKIFEKYAEIIDLSSEVEEHLEDVFSEAKQHDTNDIQNIAKNLRSQAAQLLTRYVTKIEQSNADIDTLTEDILTDLETHTKETAILVSSFKVLRKKSKNLSIEDVRNTEFNTKKATELSPEEILEMRSLYAKNYVNKPELQQELLRGFDEIVEKETTKFYIYKYYGKIVAFDRFDYRDDGSLYFGSFNVTDNYRGAALGDALMEQTLDVLAQEHSIGADCSAYEAIGMTYVERKGFVADRFYLYKDTESFHLTRDHNMHYKSKDMEQDDIIARAYVPRFDGIEIVVADKQSDLPFDRLNDGEVLTRYFIRTGKFYCVFEKQQH